MAMSKKISIISIVLILSTIVFAIAIYFKNYLAAEWTFDLPNPYVRANFNKQNNIFYVGEPVSFTLDRSGATRYEIRNYWGDLVEEANIEGLSISSTVSEQGWYKLYLYGVNNDPKFGTVVGGDVFSIFNNDENFPPRPPKGTQAHFGNSANDNIFRGLTAIGPNRHSITDISNATTAINKVESDINQDISYYMAYDDPQRPRKLLIAFPNGTKGQEANVTIVANHFKNNVKYWEPRNEPNITGYGGNAAGFVTEEMCPFYNAVKAADPTLQVIGPGTVSTKPNDLNWIRSFLSSGGSECIDAFSFHAYNSSNGDLDLTRKTMRDLRNLLAEFNLQDIEMWQTEQGYAAPIYGSYQPRHQGHWIMMQKMVFEQFGIPKEQDHYWYDKSHGFWDFPMWLVAGDGSDGLQPGGPLIRVWSENLYGTSFSEAYDFGEADNKILIGSLFTGPTKSVAVFMNNNAGEVNINVSVSSGTTLNTTDGMGVSSEIAVNEGVATITVPEIPIYINLQAGQTLSVISRDLGQNLALLSGTTISAPGEHGNMQSPKSSTNNINKVINGKEENWYYRFWESERPWSSGTIDYPAPVDITLDAPSVVNSVRIFASQPWQQQGSLLHYDLQYYNHEQEQWLTIESVEEPTKTWKVFTPKNIGATSVDSFYSERWIFVHQFNPVFTDKIRILVKNVTYGGGATAEVGAAGGQTGPKQIVLKEVEIYAPYEQAQRLSVEGVVKDSGNNPLSNITIKEYKNNQIIDSVHRDIHGNRITLSGYKAEPELVRTETTNAQGGFSFDQIARFEGITLIPQSTDYTFEPSSITITALEENKEIQFKAITKASASGVGLRGDYYIWAYDYAKMFSAEYFRFSKIDPTINYSFLSFIKSLGIDDKMFTIRWQGFLEVPTTGEYTLSMLADDATRVWVDGELLWEHWTSGNGVEKSATINLNSNKRATIKVEYFQLHSDAVARLYWSGPGITKTIIPTEYLYPIEHNIPPAIGFQLAKQEIAWILDSTKNITLSTQDVDDEVAKIELYSNNQLLATKTEAPWQFTLDNKLVATNRLYAVATDTRGAQTISRAININYRADYRKILANRLTTGINMVAIPQASNQNFSAIFEGTNYDPGIDYDPKYGQNGKSKILEYKNAAYVRYDKNSENIRPQKGKGYFMRVFEGDDINGSNYRFEDDARVEVSIEPGWNLLGNPFYEALSLDQIRIKQGDSEYTVEQARDLGLIVDYFYSWERSISAYKFITRNNTYSSQSNQQATIDSYRGFWLYQRAEKLHDLKVVYYR